MRGGVFDLFSLGFGIDIMAYPWHAYHFVFVIPKKALGWGGGGLITTATHRGHAAILKVAAIFDNFCCNFKSCCNF